MEEKKLCPFLDRPCIGEGCMMWIVTINPPGPVASQRTGAVGCAIPVSGSILWAQTQQLAMLIQQGQQAQGKEKPKPGRQN